MRHEFLLVATRGTCTPDMPKLFDSVVSIERTEHSRKPPEFRRMIETLYPHGKRVELFAREAVASLTCLACRPAGAGDVLHLRQMGNALTIRLPEELAEWLEETSQKSGISRGEIVRRELERARKQGAKPWMRLAGSVKGLPPDASMRKGFSRK